LEIGVAVTVKGELVVGLKVVEVAVRVYPVPARSILKSVKVAVPLESVMTEVVPDKIPGAEPVPRVRVIRTPLT
jgi:hypothetical protein